ncbi:MAG: ATP-dependent helicase UvrD/PcrA [Actinomycetota bacterium]|jgi:DNA helicase-2/ATP-dependent DNA helicase PcrA|nr:ATP-dependent helicase UvrD/PcrA [Actinomycetota bacterium]
MSDPRKSDAIKAALKGYEPTDEQWRAISHPLEPLYLIAGAGSGKTAVMAARIAWALENQPFSPSQILGLTFTNKAAGELQERVRLALAGLHDETGEDVTIQTYNAFAAGIVRDNGLLVGVEPEAGLLSEAQQWQLVLSCLDELPPFDALEIRSSYVVRSILGLAGSVADHMANLGDIEASADRMLSLPNLDDKVADAAAKRKELVRAVAGYVKAKHRASRIDFGDQVTKAVDVLTLNEEVRDSYRRRYPFVLLDEYQDTNVVQRKMLQALIGVGGAVTAVGDARQAIFAWRGATMYNLIGFPDDFPRSNGLRYEPVSLSENFRSGSNILDVANAIVEPIDASRRPGDPLRAVPGNGEGHVQIGLFTDERAEANWIAARCEELHGTPTAEGREPVAWSDIAILVRRKAAMDMLLQALEEREIPVEVVGLGGLLKTPEVTEVVAWLRSLESKPGANRWLARMLLGPRWRISYRDLSLLAHWATSQNWDLRMRLAGGDEELARDMEPGDVGYSLAEALTHLDEIEHLGAEAKTRLSAFAERLSAMRKKSNAPLLELVQEIIRRGGIADALDSSSSRAAPAAKQNISNFLDQVASFAPVEGEATLRSFIAYLDAAADAEETLEATQPADQDSVKLMTVHSAKGLEFECVFVPSVAASANRHGEKVWSIFPNTTAPNPLTSYSELPYEVREDAEHLPSFEGKLADFQKAVKERVIEDERRLFYVALTRAKQRLAVTASWWYGRDKREKGSSQFWDELDALEERGLLEVVERAELPEANPLFEAMKDRAVWPPSPRVGAIDPLFPQGWGSAADEVVGGATSIEQLVGALDEAGRTTAAELSQIHDRDLDVISSALGAEPPAQPRVPDILSATSLVRLNESDITAWDLVRPLPDRPTTARRMGTEVHRLIEENSRGMSPFADETELDEPSKMAEPSRITELLDNWRESGYAERRIAELPSGEPMVELPFSLRFNGQIVRGRIDAVYERDEGGLEIVDFKTGARFEPPELDQLAIYAKALKANGLLTDNASVKLTYLFLDGDAPVSRTLDPAEIP